MINASFELMCDAIIPLLQRIAFQTYRGPLDFDTYIKRIVYGVAEDKQV